MTHTELPLQPEKNWGKVKKRRNVYLSKQKGSRLIDQKKQNIYPVHVFLVFQNPRRWMNNLLLLNLINYSEFGLEWEKAKELQDKPAEIRSIFEVEQLTWIRCLQDENCTLGTFLGATPMGMLRH